MGGDGGVESRGLDRLSTMDDSRAMFDKINQMIDIVNKLQGTIEPPGKNKGILTIEQRTVLKLCADYKWLTETFPDAEVQSVHYDFNSGCFEFLVKSSKFSPVKDGEEFPSVRIKPTLGNPPGDREKSRTENICNVLVLNGFHAAADYIAKRYELK